MSRMASTKQMYNTLFARTTVIFKPGMAENTAEVKKRSKGRVEVDLDLTILTMQQNVMTR